MKKVLIALAVFSSGILFGQSTSKEIEIYERYENGELVEERKSAKENGQAIENFDFEQAKKDMNIDFQEKSTQMRAKMQEMMEKSSRMMDTKMVEMEQKMQELQQRAEKMQLEMKKRMNSREISPSKFDQREREPLHQNKQPQEQAPVNNNSSNGYYY